MGPGRRPAPQALLAAAFLALLPRPGVAGPFIADASSGHIVVHAVKAGLLSGLAHDHRLLAERWRADVAWDLEGSGAFDLRIVVDASSLRETTTRLGEASRALIGREVAGPEVLDAGRFPEIRVRAAGMLPSPPRGEEERDGEMRAEVTLRGETRSLPVAFRLTASGAGFRARGTVLLRQTDFGMTPFTTAMGTIGVDDELRIEFDLLLHPRPP
jgi:polyisoprenoid-binding protein YceI